MKSVIVTVTDTTINKYYDVELPVNMPAKDLLVKIISVIRTFDYDFGRNISSKRIRVEHLGRYLDGDETLEEIGVWDGSLLNLEWV